jgi:hypothetical protein
VGTSLGTIAGSLIFGLSQVQALVILFVVLPFVLAAIVVPLVAWRSSNGPRPVLTSDILAHGLPGSAEITAVKTLGSVLELRPMVRFNLLVRGDGAGPPFDLEVFQALPRGVIGRFRPGAVVEIRLTPDHSAGAVVWGEGPPPGP